MKYRAAFGPVAVIVLFVIGVFWSPFEPHAPPADPSGAPSGTASWAEEDWNVFASTVRSAAASGADTMAIGAAMATIGRSLVGTAYVPGTLEVEGDERLVINFRGLDCVTFVENVHALATVVKAGAADRLDERGALESEYEQALVRLRYRSGVVDGYTSRLHYFTDWIADNQRKLLLTDVTGELGGVPDAEPIDFMSTHPDAYRQLSDPGVLEDIRDMEQRLSARGRIYLPESRIGPAMNAIRDGDIIAATSTVAGLDVAHTGIALWVDGTLRLMHAPLVGEAVQISEETIAERIQRIGGQDGIIVARPNEPLTTSRGSRPAGD